MIIQTLSGADDSLSAGGSNWPYRGKKNQATEGGTKIPTLIASPLLPSYGIYQNLFHITGMYTRLD